MRAATTATVTDSCPVLPLNSKQAIFFSKMAILRAWRVDFGVMEWGVMRAAIPLGCYVVGVAES